MLKTVRMTLILVLFLVTGYAKVTGAAEPQLLDYTSYPIFTVNPVKPNILIMLDNSGSMNLNAYGSEVSDNGIVTDQPYAGVPYRHLAYKVTASADDAEEQLSNGDTGISNGSQDLDLGRYNAGDSSATVIGLRFRNIQLPDNAKITEAWLEFYIQRTPTVTENEPISLEIVGEDTDNASEFKNENKNISNTSTRPETDARVTWGSDTLDPWSPVNDIRKTPDLKDIVQEIIDREGWKTGNACAFKIRYKSSSVNAKRDVFSYDGSYTKAPVLHIRYKTDPVETKYYGYFNPEWFYTFSSNQFKHAYKKVSYNETGSCWNVTYPDRKSVV